MRQASATGLIGLLGAIESVLKDSSLTIQFPVESEALVTALRQLVQGQTIGWADMDELDQELILERASRLLSGDGDM